MICVVDVVGANIRSLESSLRRIGISYKLTCKAEDLQQASHVILAGVSAAEQVMQALRQHHLITVLQQLKVPVLGICSGMQVLYAFSEEAGIGCKGEESEKESKGEKPKNLVPCLGILPGTVTKIPSAPHLSLPHSGWNQLERHHASPFDFCASAYVYFVHSYQAPFDEQHTFLSTHHGVDIPALVGQRNYWGVQFHPEKSGTVGEDFLRRFCCL